VKDSSGKIHDEGSLPARYCVNLWIDAPAVIYLDRMMNAARGMVKSYGQRLPKCGTQQVNRELAAGLRELVEPLLKEIESLNERIQEYDERMEKIAKEVYPEASLLKQVKGCRNTDRADLYPDH
jgi:transposase